MRIDFQLRGIAGSATVEVEPNLDPASVGAGPNAQGFPMCDVQVHYPARGYDAVLGWVQLVRSGDNVSGGSAFELDPLEFLGEPTHPFAWIGLEPRAFDAPSRTLPLSMDWVAHTFLCVPDGSSRADMSVHALAGFSWGFRCEGSEVTMTPASLLTPDDWNAHVGTLATLFPDWEFVSGFRSD